MKTTKGKWSYQLWEPNSEPQCTIYSDIAGRTKIADVGFFKDMALDFEEEAEANAKLIAAAPELLEALKDVVSLVDKWRLGHLPTLLAAKEVIKKATD